MSKFQKYMVAKFSLANLEKSVEDDAINPDSKFHSQIPNRGRLLLGSF